jgi:hypothetical protein
MGVLPRNCRGPTFAKFEGQWPLLTKYLKINHGRHLLKAVICRNFFIEGATESLKCP